MSQLLPNPVTSLEQDQNQSSIPPHLLAQDRTYCSTPCPGTQLSLQQNPQQVDNPQVLLPQDQNYLPQVSQQRQTSMAFLAPLLPAIATSLISTLSGTALRKIIGDAPSEDIVQLATNGLDSNLGQIIQKDPQALTEFHSHLPEWQRVASERLSGTLTPDQQSTTSLMAGQSGNSTSQIQVTPAGSTSQNSLQEVVSQQPSHFLKAVERQNLPMAVNKETSHMLTTSTTPQLTRQSAAPLVSAQQFVSPQTTMINNPQTQISDSRQLTPTLSENSVRYAANIRALQAAQEKLRVGTGMVSTQGAQAIEQGPGIATNNSQKLVESSFIKDNLRELGKEVASGIGRSMLYSLTGRESRADRLRASVPYVTRAPGRVQITEVTDEASPPTITQSHTNALLPYGVINREPQNIINQGNQALFDRPYSFSRNQMLSSGRLQLPTNRGEEARRASVGMSMSDTLKSGIGNIANAALSSAARFAIKKIVGDAPTGMVKVVGDAPIPTGSVALSSGSDRKIVGDAPVGEATLGDDNAKKMDATTASGADKSTVLRYLSLLQTLEQTMLIDSCSDWGNFEHYMRGLVINFKHVLAMYDYESISLQPQEWGSAFMPNILVSGVRDDARSQMRCLFRYIRYCWRVDCIIATNSIPVLATNDASNLMTATRGGTITEFSSAMRLNLSVWTSETLAYLVHLVADMMRESAGYSFSETLTRLLLALQNMYPIPGTEASEWWTGVSWREISPHVANDFWARDYIFPFNAVDITAGGYNGIPIAVVTYGQFILHAASKTNVMWLDEWSVTTWNTSTAVIFIKNEDRMDPLRFFAKLLSAMESPFYCYTMAMEPWGVDLNPQNPGWRNGTTLPFINNDNPIHLACTPTSNCVYVPGPRDRILVVLLDERTLGANDVGIQIPNTPLVGVYSPINYGLRDVVGGNSPFRNPVRVDNFFVPWNCFNNYINRDVIANAIQREIANWERDFGNTSDRSQAMRLVGNFSQAFGPTKMYNRARPQANDPVRMSITVMPSGTEVNRSLRWPDVFNVTYVNAETTFNYLLGAASLTTDAAGLFPHTEVSDDDTWSPEINYEDACNINCRSPYTHYTIGARNVLMDLVVLKNLGTVGEELPSALLSTSTIVDVAVMKTMGQLISQTTDVIHQELNIDWWTKTLATDRELYVVAQNVNHTQVTYNLIQQSLKRATDLIFNVGIQFPNIQTDLFQNALPNVRRDACRTLYEGTLLIYVPFSRIPIWSHKNKGRVFDLSNNVINFTQGCIARATTHYSLDNTGAFPPQAQMSIYDDLLPRHPDIDEITISGVRLTLAEMPGVLSNNTTTYVTGYERKNFSTKMGYAYVQPHASLSNSLALSRYNDNIVIQIGSNFKALPSGYMPPTVCYLWGDMTCLSLLNGADKDTFLSGSSNWKIFVIPESKADTLTANMPDLPEFQTFGDIRSIFSY